MKPNPSCEDNNCRKQQEMFKARPKVEQMPVETPDLPLHSSNEWGKSLVF